MRVVTTTAALERLPEDVRRKLEAHKLDIARAQGEIVVRIFPKGDGYQIVIALTL